MKSRWQSLTTSIGLLILRLGFGAFMIGHGWSKVEMLMDGKFDAFADPIGLGKSVSLVLVVLAEVICAVLIMLGLATRLAAIPIVIAMGVAAFVVHANDPWTMGPGASKEPALLFMTVFVTLILTGPGMFSVDGLIMPWFRRKKSDKP